MNRSPAYAPPVILLSPAMDRRLEVEALVLAVSETAIVEAASVRLLCSQCGTHAVRLPARDRVRGTPWEGNAT